MAGARCRTLYPFSGERHSQGLRFSAGELLTLLQVPDGGWWEGEKDDGLRGWFPASYVQLLEVRGQGRGRGPATLQTSPLWGTKGAGEGLGRGQRSPPTQPPEHVVAARGKRELVACASSGAGGRATADDRGHQGAAETGGLGKARG